MKNFLKKYKIQVAISAYLIFVAAAYFLFARPMIKSVEEKNNNIQEKIADQEGRMEKLKDLASIKNQAEMVDSQKDKIEISLNKENVVNLVEKLEKISEETDNLVKINIVEDDARGKTPTAQSKNKKEVKTLIESLPSANYIKINISIEGNYRSFLDFLKKLENMEYYSDIVSVKIKKDAVAEDISSNPFVNNQDSTGKVIIDEKNKISSTIETVFYLGN